MKHLLQTILQAKGEFRAKHGVEPTHIFLDSEDRIDTNTCLYGLTILDVPLDCSARFIVGLIEYPTRDEK